MINKIITLFFTMCWVTAAHSKAMGFEKVMDCTQASLAKMDVGNAYRGVMLNEDYEFSAKIPSGFTGWGGVDQDAPFHGFTIFLDPEMKSCIVFEIHIRVNDGDFNKSLNVAKSLHLGEAQAWQSIRHGEIDNSEIINIRTAFSFKRPDRIDDGEVILVAPTSKLVGVKHVYDTFLQSLQFRHLNRNSPAK